MLKRINKFIKDWPKLSYILITKVLCIIGFSFFVFLTQLYLLFWQSLIIIFCYNLLFVPVGYWLTYSFGNKK